MLLPKLYFYFLKSDALFNHSMQSPAVVVARKGGINLIVAGHVFALGYLGESSLSGEMR